MRPTIAAALLALLPACLPDGASAPLDGATDDAAVDAAPDTAPGDPPAECGDDGCAPVLDRFEAWAGDDAIHFVVAARDADADLAEIGARHLDGTWIGGDLRFAPDAAESAHARPLAGAPMPAEIELFAADRAGHVTVARVALRPLPIRAAGEGCDLRRVTDACEAPLACRTGACAAIGAPVLEGAALFTTGDTIGIEVTYNDPDDDLFVMRVEIEGLGRTVDFRPDNDTRGRCFRRARGTLWVDDVPVGARGRVMLFDREGLSSAALEVPFEVPRVVGEGAACDRFASVAVCEAGLVCDEREPRGQADVEPWCFPARAECPAGWAVTPIAPGARVELDWRPLTAGREAGEIIAAAAEAQLTWGSCRLDGPSPVAVFAFTAGEAGTYDVFLQRYDGGPAGTLWARRYCEAPVAGEIGCDRGADGGSMLELALEAGERVTIFAAASRIWEGEQRYQLSVSGYTR
ncbi:MAG: hypothetical protein R3F65_14985 [bacterium]